ncbi:hypothetical protein M427DRAFT_94501 [Gonapodya prolifera JEL478]|uniref:separase n=1 Tax=Gonapodya prolifera (strain JEL478) TaxID=1344416 RepID=A0A139ATX0_GONPJ|nr:hypothetical protein M427DRAFT_94501 [Gonapodya prolifera JEL478]|eukprot:KXS20158.1 hypothetical protein M427DRAFT_94501 [Gonapodya prolifera JEL478]
MTPELFQRGFIEKLPENLVVCSLSLDSERDDLYLTRMTKDSNPVMVKLPLGRYGNRESAEEGFEYGSRNIFCTFSDLMARSKASIKKAGSCSTKQDKMRWWEERATLDKQLETLLFQIESTGLGGFKCLLLPSSPKSETEISEFRKSLGSALYRATSPKSSNISSMEINRELCVALMELGSNPSDSDVEDIMFYFLDSLHYGGNPIDYGEIDADMLSAEIHLAFEKIHSPPPPIDASTVLLIDKQLQQLPWESLPVLRGRPVTRLPTLSFLRDRLELAPSWRENQSRMGVYTVNQTRISYVLNPDGDLVGTERNFRDLLSCQSNWQGLVGERPTESDMKDFLCNKDVFIYFGHNGGEQYIRGQKVRRLERSAVALLMGCSSGYLQDGGEFDPTGTALNFLMAGSPALVANLWDVTDKDIDRFSVNLLQEWGLLRSSSDLSGAECQESKSLAQCVTSSREKCTFKFLNGAAPVVYGVPWVFVR